jgi:hypothetical protein
MLKKAKRANFASIASSEKFLAGIDLGDNDFLSLALKNYDPTSRALFPFGLQPDRFTTSKSVIGGLSRFGVTAAGVDAGAPSAKPADTAPALGVDVDSALALRDKVKQGFAVGSGLLSFDESVTADRRAAAIHSTLLAQLVADKAYPDKSDPAHQVNWYGSYYNTLINIGWVIQEDSALENQTGSASGEVSEELITLAKALVGAGGAAAIAAVFQSLSNLGNDNAILEVFKKTSAQNSLAQFSVGLASQDPKDGFMMKALEFNLKATAEDTQVLFFHWKSQHCSFSWRNIQLSVADDIYAGIADKVKAKVATFVNDFVNEIKL